MVWMGRKGRGHGFPRFGGRAVRCSGAKACMLENGLRGLLCFFLFFFF